MPRSRGWVRYSVQVCVELLTGAAQTVQQHRLGPELKFWNHTVEGGNQLSKAVLLPPQGMHTH